jgi:hypothetical protein
MATRISRFLFHRELKRPEIERSGSRSEGVPILLFVLIAFAVPAHAQSGFEIGAFGTYTFLKKIGTRDVGVGTEAAGIGGRFVYHAMRYLDLDGDIVMLPGNSATTGNIFQGLAGPKMGLRFKRAGFFAKTRAGFLHFRRDPFGVGASSATFFSHERAHSTEPNLDAGGVAEFYTSNGLIFRLDIADSIVKYARRMVHISDFLPDLESGGFTTHNVQVSFGINIRFPN